MEALWNVGLGERWVDHAGHLAAGPAP